MRLPYTANPPTFSSPTDQAILSRVQARRGPKGLIPLDLTLLHAPAIADGWNAMLGAVRTKTSLSPDIRELCICRVALLNKAWFEWDAHAPILETEGGFSKEQMGVVADVEASSNTNDNKDGEEVLSPKQLAVLRYADAMTRDVVVSQEVFDEVKVKGQFSEQEVVEITATVAAYNMVSRFLVALDVGEMNGKGVGEKEVVGTGTKSDMRQG